MALRPLLRQELPWLVSEFVLLIVLLNANPPELWFNTLQDAPRYGRIRDNVRARVAQLAQRDVP